MSNARQMAEEYMKNFEEMEKEARKERKKSVKWKIVNQRCTQKQIDAIKLFIEYRLFEGAASIAEMTVLDFVLLLEELEISRV